MFLLLATLARALSGKLGSGINGLTGGGGSRTRKSLARTVDYKSTGLTDAQPLRRKKKLLVVSRPQAVLLKAKDIFIQMLGWGLERFHSPARLKEFEFVDPDSNETVYLYTTRIYSVLCVGSRRFYFDRISGKYDGTSAPSDCVARRIELAD